ncbi:MAG: hypothetical protein VB959_15135, partial [Rhodospirillales bacterium]
GEQTSAEDRARRRRFIGRYKFFVKPVSQFLLKNIGCGLRQAFFIAKSAKKFNSRVADCAYGHWFGESDRPAWKGEPGRDGCRPLRGPVQTFP